MAIIKSTGLTESERYLSELCEKTFLGLWSYPNVYRDQRISPTNIQGKELCDLLVVCGNDIVIFSDKVCELPDSGDLKRDWQRWFKRAVIKSANQLFGAERWIGSNPDRLFIDSACQERLPLQLPPAAEQRVHRVVIAKGAKERCKQTLGGSGSLLLRPALTGNAHTDHPFHVGQVDPSQGFVHVLDDVTFQLILEELDTVADFLGYLRAKEQLIAKDRLGPVAGEENLLALYLRAVCQGHHEIPFPDLDATYIVVDGVWDEFVRSEDYRTRKEADKVSYIWDGIIREFGQHTLAGTLIPGSPPGVDANETIVRIMAREPRYHRRHLAAVMMDRWAMSPTDADAVSWRTCLSMGYEGAGYVFQFSATSQQPDPDYRHTRQMDLFGYSFVLACKHRQYQPIVGVATEAGNEPYRTFDLVLVDPPEWTSELESMAAEIQDEMQVLGSDVEWIKRSPPATNPTRPAPMSSFEAPPTPLQREVRVPRNAICPCGSGKKYKRCCMRASEGTSV